MNAPSEASPCPLCAQPRGVEALECRDSRGVMRSYRYCAACGGYSLDPLPSPGELAAMYDEAYYGSGERKLPALLDAVRNLALRRRAARVARWLGRRGRILDVGCGDGRFLAHMQALGFEIMGLELPGIALERARKRTGAPLREGPLAPGMFPDRSFDLITIWHVLEHVVDPRELLATCRALLKDDGRLVVEVPNLDSWQSRLGGAGAFNLDPPRHLHQLPPSALDRLVEETGFSVERRETLSLEMGVMGAMQTLLNHWLAPRDLLFDLLRSRFSCPGSTGAKAASVAWAPVLVVPATVFTMLEAAGGRGAVLRVVCRPR
ncbi:MAG: class I SAM-dependent methyltransferase [Kiritimatiellae bacterium]|nr:class I SAM-dependent methyltransferase [Kiritimatiellia bacterium]